MFIAIATGQTVSNLPPILEHAQPGDAVLWVESREARIGKWTAGANEVLHRAGLTILSPSLAVDDINDPVGMHRAAQARVQDYADWRPVIVTNGGPKLSPIGLLNAWEPRRPVILYGNVPAAHLRVFPAGLQKSPEDRPYQRHRLDLEDILRCSGHACLHPAIHLWPSDAPLPMAEYGVDPQYTQQVHQEHHQFYACQNKAFPSFDIIKRCEQEALPLKNEMKKWRRALLDFFRRVKNGSSHTTPEEFLDCNPDTPTSLYNATCNLIKAANRRENGIQPASDLGKLFEQAVAHRLIAWLQQWPETSRIIQSVWSNIHIGRDQAPHTQIAEWDIVLVLRNGLLWCIECKSFDAGQKDLDARLLNLQKASTNLADMVVCAPLYTGFAKEVWFAPMHDLKNRVETASRFSFLPFTLPDQPSEYPVPAHPSNPQHCPSFETALEKLLQRYV